MINYKDLYMLAHIAIQYCIIVNGQRFMCDVSVKKSVLCDFEYNCWSFSWDFLTLTLKAVFKNKGISTLSVSLMHVN